MRELPRRKRNRLAGYDYRQNGAYVVTICAKDRAELFGTIVPGTNVGATVPGRPNKSVSGHPHIQLTELGKIVDTAIQHNNRAGITIDRYVVMPNHVHMIVMITDENGMDFGTGNDGRTTGGGKYPAGDRGRSPLQMIIRNMKSYVSKQIGFSPWQKSFHDHIIRNEDEYFRIAQYIQDNPINWKQDCFYTVLDENVSSSMRADLRLQALHDFEAGLQTCEPLPPEFDDILCQRVR
jgi:REP element-mobilizing transposase RayT